MQVCGAKTRSGKPCQGKPMDNGRCRMHGGGAGRPIIHGRYSKYLKESLQSKLAAVSDDNPLDLIPELDMQRALFADYVSRFNEGFKLGASDVDYLIGWSAEIGRMVERIVKMRNDTALTAAEVSLIAMRIPEVVVKYIDDPDRQRAFIEDLFGAVGAAQSASPRQPAKLPSRV